MGLTKNLGWLSKYITADSSGYVGLGTTPAEKLTLESGNILLRTQGRVIFNRADNLIFTQLYDSGPYFVLDNRNGNGFDFQSTGTSQMRITSGGAVLIGTTTYSGYKLEVNDGQVRFKSNISAWGTISTNNSKSTVYSAHGDGYGLAIDTIANTWSLYTFKVSGGNGTTAGTNEYFKISGTGALYSAPTYSNTSGSGANLGIASDGFFYRSTSSLKYKKNVENYEKGLNEIMQMRPVTYNSINEREEGITYAGLIAEEIHDLGLTEFVQYANDGTPDALAYSNMVALLVKAIQELTERIKTLENK